MKKDQLILYASNHRGVMYNVLVFAAIFVTLRHHMYGWPELFAFSSWHPKQGQTMLDFLLAKDDLSYTEEIWLLGFCFATLWRQRKTYARIISGKFKESECRWLVGQICFNKLLYLIPWLILMFMPMKIETLWQHVLGYVFVFSLTAATASTSAPVLPLLIFDIGVPTVFALFVTALNLAKQETAYAGAAVAVFSVYVFFIGWKIRASTVQLIDSKIQLQQSAKRADEANRAKSSFLALMSHEIRTPMTGIFGMIDFLRETNLTEEQKEFVVTIRDCSKTLLNTLNDILDFSKIESGKLAISKVNFDLHGVMNNSGRVLREIAGNKGLELIVEIDPTVPQFMYGDPHRMQQVIMNLLNNAVKFTERGTVELRAFFMETEQPRIHVEVRDTGIGISKENMAKLFGAFSQADDSIARKYGGSGLGLSIAKNLIKLMGGRIDVMSEEGKGSTFWFELPYQAPVEGAEGEAERDVADAPPQNILVVEDNPVNARIVTRMLAHKGHKATVAQDGDMAIQMVQEADYDLVFMDVNMPGRNGMDTTRAIHALGGKFKKLPIIGLSANIMEESVRKCYDAGMIGHVAKPFAPKDIYLAIAAVAQGKDAVPAPKAVKKPPNANKTMAEVHAAIVDEMGPAYLKEMVAGNLKEVARLFETVVKEAKTRNFELLGRAAHDLKSVSGLIGMQRTSQLAAAVENACITGEHARLAETIANLEHMRTQEEIEVARLMGAGAATEESSRFIVQKN